MYKVQFFRSKTVGPPEQKEAFVVCPKEIQVLHRYVERLRAGSTSTIRSQIQVEVKYGSRLFRKLSKHMIPGQVVGKHTLSQIGVNLAKELGLLNANKYTGHCWRRTAATLAAEAGSTLAEIKTLTGHRSDNVAYNYIANSDKMKLKMAVALMCASDCRQLGEKSTERPVNTCEDREKVRRESSAATYSFSNCTFGSVSGGIGHGHSMSSSSDRS